MSYDVLTYTSPVADDPAAHLPTSLLRTASTKLECRTLVCGKTLLYLLMRAILIYPLYHGVECRRHVRRAVSCCRCIVSRSSVRCFDTDDNCCVGVDGPLEGVACHLIRFQPARPPASRTLVHPQGKRNGALHVHAAASLNFLHLSSSALTFRSCVSAGQSSTPEQPALLRIIESQGRNMQVETLPAWGHIDSITLELNPSFSGAFIDCEC